MLWMVICFISCHRWVTDASSFDAISFIFTDLENLLQFGFSHIQPRRDPCTKPQKFKKGSIISGMKRNLSQEELERVVSINFEVPYADLDIVSKLQQFKCIFLQSKPTMFHLLDG